MREFDPGLLSVVQQCLRAHPDASCGTTIRFGNLRQSDGMCVELKKSPWLKPKAR